MPRPEGPVARAKIAPSRLAQEVARTWARGAPGVAPPVIAFSSKLEETHRKDPRRYAECVQEPGVRGNVGRKGGTCRTIFFARSILSLPAAHRLGLIAHECGHLALWDSHPDHSEDDADDAALAFFGVRVSYDKRWPGKGLQTGRLVR